MSSMKPTPAKIIHHSEGFGVPSADTVRRRAEELAKINGHEEFNDDDWREAKRELHGGERDWCRPLCSLWRSVSLWA